MIDHQLFVNVGISVSVIDTSVLSGVI